MKTVRTNETAWVEHTNRGNYSQRRKALGGEKLSCGLWELAPGKKSFPFHSHLVTEEAMFVVFSRGQVRTPEGMTPISTGDCVSFPPGAGAHQLLNDGSEPLVYVGMSATIGIDIVEYPDTGKLAAAVGAPGKGQRFLYEKDKQVGYCDGDPDA